MNKQKRGNLKNRFVNCNSLRGGSFSRASFKELNNFIFEKYE